MSLHYANKPPIEVVLENGSFARIRRPTRGDMLAALREAKGDMGVMVAVLVTLTTTVDDEPVSLAEWMEADFELTNPIANALNRIFEDANRNPSRGGVA